VLSWLSEEQTFRSGQLYPNETPHWPAGPAQKAARNERLQTGIFESSAMTNKPKCALTEGECLEGCQFGFSGVCPRRQTMRRRPTVAHLILRRSIIAALVTLALMLAAGAWLL